MKFISLVLIGVMILLIGGFVWTLLPNKIANLDKAGSWSSEPVDMEYWPPFDLTSTALGSYLHYIIATTTNPTVLTFAFPSATAEGGTMNLYYDASTTLSGVHITFDASNDNVNWFSVDKLANATSSNVIDTGSTTVNWVPGVAGVNNKTLVLPPINSKYFRAVFTGYGDFGALWASVRKINR